MESELDRREFLKRIGLLGGGLGVSLIYLPLNAGSKERKPYKFDKRGFLIGAHTLIDIRNYLKGHKDEIREWPIKPPSIIPRRYNDAKKYVQKLNREVYLEANNWEIPSEEDLKSILVKREVPKGIISSLHPPFIYQDLWKSTEIRYGAWTRTIPCNDMLCPLFWKEAINLLQER